MAVEVGLVTPILLLILVAGIHFGRVFAVRHRFDDAVHVATRSAAISPTDNETSIEQRVRDRMRGETDDCTSFDVDARLVPTNATGSTSRLDVTVVCRVRPLFGSSGLLGSIGPDQMTASSSAPWRGGAITAW